MSIFLLLAGCASRDLLQEQGAEAVELADTPFFPQRAYQCGPAALATLLAASGSQVSLSELASQVYLPGRRGSLQLELVSASRRHNRIPYVIDPDFETLLAELEAGRPVLVLQNLGLESAPVWHYSVVVGVDPASDRVVLRSGTKERLLMPAARFLKSWQRAGRWALVLLQPGEMPANPDPDRYLKAVAGLESSGKIRAAQRSYKAALQRWPGDPAALFGLANSYRRQGMPGKAVLLYRGLLIRHPEDPVVLNNLADALAAAGCPREALEVIEDALALPIADVALRRIFLQTRSEILDALKRPGSTKRCAEPKDNGIPATV